MRERLNLDVLHLLKERLKLSGLVRTALPGHAKPDRKIDLPVPLRSAFFRMQGLMLAGAAAETSGWIPGRGIGARAGSDFGGTDRGVGARSDAGGGRHCDGLSGLSAPRVGRLREFVLERCTGSF